MSITLELEELGPGERERHMQIELACRYYTNGWLSHDQDARPAVMAHYAFGVALAERGILLRRRSRAPSNPKGLHIPAQGWTAPPRVAWLEESEWIAQWRGGPTLGSRCCARPTLKELEQAGRLPRPQRLFEAWPSRIGRHRLGFQPGLTGGLPAGGPSPTGGTANRPTN